jgi:hypothetical protein
MLSASVCLAASIGRNGQQRDGEVRPDASKDETAFRCRDGTVEEATDFGEDGEALNWHVVRDCFRGCRLDIAEFTGATAARELCEDARYGVVPNRGVQRVH